MKRFLSSCAVVVLVGCAGLTAPKTFLQTTNPPSQAWLNSIVEIDLHNVPVADLPRREVFAGLMLVLDDVDGNAVVSLTAPRLTRRQALWKLADKYGLTMTLVETADHPVALRLTSRQARRENRPLN
ncbi:MAG: hypothetical protein PCFJNLEI_01072 [Verrucomicrobiae bacterium]|nr:hypothetical protein [Verrucomicrobiae bacterium]